MNIHVIDDFLPEEWVEPVYTAISTSKFVFADHTVALIYSDLPKYSGDLLKKVHDSPQLVSTYMENNILEESATPFLPYLFAGVLASKTGMDTTKILRCKANLNIPELNRDSDSFYTPHVDFSDLCGVEDFVTAIYYANDSTGDTFFFSLGEENELKELHRIEPKRNRIVYFDGSIIHAGSPPASGKRIVLNMDFVTTFKQPKSEA